MPKLNELNKQQQQHHFNNPTKQMGNNKKMSKAEHKKITEYSCSRNNGNANVNVKQYHNGFIHVNTVETKNNLKSDKCPIKQSPQPNQNSTFYCNYAEENASDEENDHQNVDIMSNMPAYENMHFNDLQADKKLLLQKYFRSALVEPRSNIYENLCRGCNYGVFNARGPLCSFCECIVSGVSAIKDTSCSSLTNIYENICDKCNQIYSSNQAQCHCSTSSSSSVKIRHKSEENLDNLNKDEKEVKLKKSKSFNKADNKRSNILSSFLENWKRNRTSSDTKTQRKKSLDIQHNVEGYEQVFHTQETFDFQKICELKRHDTSYSDQHIYGRLKQNDVNGKKNSQTLPLHVRTESLTTCSTNSTNSNGSKSSNSNLSTLSNKRPRISKPRFLRLYSLPQVEVQVSLEKPKTREKQSLYLPDSVCQWMTSLRREIYNYGLMMGDDLCYPKSIPAKQALYCLRTQQNSENIIDNEADFVMPRGGSKEDFLFHQQQRIKPVSPPVVINRYQHMIEEFKRNLWLKEMRKDYTQENHFDEISNREHFKAGKLFNYNNNDYSCCAKQQQAIKQRQGVYVRLDENNSLTIDDNDISSDVVERRVKTPINTEYESNIEEKLVDNECRRASSKEHLAVSQLRANEVNGLNGLDVSRKRCGIHERNSEFVNDILSVFENLLEREKQLKDNQLQTVKSESEDLFTKIPQEKKACERLEETNKTEALPLFDNPENNRNNSLATIDLVCLISNSWLSIALNCIVIYYDKWLLVFLKRIVSPKQTSKDCEHLVRKYRKFYNKYAVATANSNSPARVTSSSAIIMCNSIQSEFDLKAKYDGSKHFMNLSNNNNNESVVEETKPKIHNYKPTIIKRKQQQQQVNNLMKTANVKETDFASVVAKAQSVVGAVKKFKIPPQVPKRDPKTQLCSISQNNYSTKQEMTIPAAQTSKSLNTGTATMEEDSIYQPIWKFKTLGEVPEIDYYDLEGLKEKTTNSVLQQTLQNESSLITEIIKTENDSAADIDDFNNWETDDDFMFTTRLDIVPITTEAYNTVGSNHSSNSNYSSMGSSSLSGSTVTGFASSTATMASALSSNFQHPLLRNIGIFYSLIDPTYRAIVYNYDRVQSALYFAKPQTKTINEKSQVYNNNDKGANKSNKIPPLPTRHRNRNNPEVISESVGLNNNIHQQQQQQQQQQQLWSKSTTTTSLCESIPDSVQAWKFLLLDVNYVEDEEDMIVSECEILRAQEIKEDIESHQTHQQNILQRFKSISSGNLIDLPIEDDKKTIAERMRNKLQRGVFKINVRSPKSEKKSRGIFRRTETTSLYLEDGLKPKYPIFGTALDHLELNQTTQPNVPRFVVDCVDYIEQRDHIIQDGLYRACGNKFSIDELKQKLMESYIYDTKLLIADDIHTVTSLLKQFFRELGSPLITQDTYERLGRNLTDDEGIEIIRLALADMKEPNRSTLKFIIKHLTNVAAHSSSNRMNSSNLAIVWGPCLLSANQIDFDIGRMNTFAKVLIENYERIFSYNTNERLVC